MYLPRRMPQADGTQIKLRIRFIRVPRLSVTYPVKCIGNSGFRAKVSPIRNNQFVLRLPQIILKETKNERNKKQKDRRTEGDFQTV